MDKFKVDNGVHVEKDEMIKILKSFGFTAFVMDDDILGVIGNNSVEMHHETFIDLNGLSNTPKSSIINSFYNMISTDNRVVEKVEVFPRSETNNICEKFNCLLNYSR